MIEATVVLLRGIVKLNIDRTVFFFNGRKSYAVLPTIGTVLGYTFFRQGSQLFQIIIILFKAANDPVSDRSVLIDRH